MNLIELIIVQIILIDLINMHITYWYANDLNPFIDT